MNYKTLSLLITNIAPYYISISINVCINEYKVKYQYL